MIKCDIMLFITNVYQFRMKELTHNLPLKQIIYVHEYTLNIFILISKVKQSYIYVYSSFSLSALEFYASIFTQLNINHFIY